MAIIKMEKLILSLLPVSDFLNFLYGLVAVMKLRIYTYLCKQKSSRVTTTKEDFLLEFNGLFVILSA